MGVYNCTFARLWLISVNLAVLTNETYDIYADNCVVSLYPFNILQWFGVLAVLISFSYYFYMEFFLKSNKKQIILINTTIILQFIYGVAALIIFYRLSNLYDSELVSSVFLNPKF